MSQSVSVNDKCCDCGKTSRKGSRLPGGSWICRKCSKTRRKAKKEGK